MRKTRLASALSQPLSNCHQCMSDLALKHIADGKTWHLLLH